MRDHITQRLMLIAPQQLQWITEELPQLGAHDVLVQSRTGAISIGSELPLYQGTSRASKPLSYPKMTGYESVGLVMARGSEVKKVQVGAKVVTFYGHCTHAVVPEAKVINVPDTISEYYF